MSKKHVVMEERPPGRCWVLVDRYFSSHTHDPNCQVPARPGMLTCRHHFEYEEQAQAVKKARDVINSASGKPCHFPDLI